jgi:SAM-dependent methyltransferase
MFMAVSATVSNCVLCEQPSPTHFSSFQAGKYPQRDYYHCAQCDLRFLNPLQRLSPTEEKNRYLNHENDVSDPGYRKFVQPLFEALKKQIPTPANGLDFGCGTGPVLYALFQEAGYVMQKYDVFFAPDTTPLRETHHFICASEVVEHFYAPFQEFIQLHRMLKPGGTLGVMTLLFDETQVPRFEDWYYMKDPTHVSLFSRKTFHYIASSVGFSSVQFQGERLVLLRK